jgi:ketosteroid isomerase-like protein
MLFCVTAKAQTEGQSALFQNIKSMDSVMFSLVYKCDAQKIESFFTEDLEFYHDKGGLTKSRAAFMEAQQKNFCGEHPFYLRREPVPGTMKVFPMDNYGAVQTGEHVFYIKGEDGKEIRDGKAKYTHIWKYEKDQWRISRVISYDHGPAR